MRFPLISILMILATGCATQNRSEEQAAEAPPWAEDTRVAEAQVTTPDESKVLGKVNFEQMPNSVIFTYHLEGLEPNKRYEMYINKDQDCEALTSALTIGEPVAKIRANKEGIAENTVRTEDVTVRRGNESLEGDSIVIRTLIPPESTAPAEAVACAEVQPQTPPVTTQ
jgi:Cu/Zn superoxide dismutase